MKLQRNVPQFIVDKMKSLQNGGLAEWLCSGLQIRGPRFDSGTRLHYLVNYLMVATKDLAYIARSREPIPTIKSNCPLPGWWNW